MSALPPKADIGAFHGLRFKRCGSCRVSKNLADFLRQISFSEVLVGQVRALLQIPATDHRVARVEVRLTKCDTRNSKRREARKFVTPLRKVADGTWIIAY